MGKRKFWPLVVLRLLKILKPKLCCRPLQTCQFLWKSVQRGLLPILLKHNNLYLWLCVPFLCFLNNFTLYTLQLLAKCREFEERYEVEMKIDNKQQKVKLETEFLPANHFAKNKVRLTIKSASRRYMAFVYYKRPVLCRRGLFRTLDSTVLLLRSRHPGIRYLTVFSSQHWVSTCLRVSWKHTFLRYIDEMYSAH